MDSFWEMVGILVITLLTGAIVHWFYVRGKFDKRRDFSVIKYYKNEPGNLLAIIVGALILGYIYAGYDIYRNQELVSGFEKILIVVFLCLIALLPYLLGRINQNKK